MRRTPVLDDGSPRVPALAPVDLLQISLAARTSRDEIRFVRSAGFEAREIVGTIDTTQGAAHAREDPPAATEMTDELAAAVFQDVRESRRRAAKRAHAEGPSSVGEEGTRGVQGPLERGTKTGVREKRDGGGANSQTPRGHFTDGATRGQERRDLEPLRVPFVGEAAHALGFLGPRRGDRLHRDGERVFDVGPIERERCVRQQRHTAPPALVARRLRPRRRRGRGRPRRPRVDQRPVRHQTARKIPAADEQVRPVVAEVRQDWIDISTTYRNTNPPASTSAAATAASGFTR